MPEPFTSLKIGHRGALDVGQPSPAAEVALKKTASQNSTAAGRKRLQKKLRRCRRSKSACRQTHRTCHGQDEVGVEERLGGEPSQKKRLCTHEQHDHRREHQRRSPYTEPDQAEEQLELPLPPPPRPARRKTKASLNRVRWHRH
jgi:hypothetical protein